MLQWMSNRVRYADLFNATVFQGEQVIQPEELELVDTESDILIKDKMGKIKQLHRYRDIVMKWKLWGGSVDLYGMFEEEELFRNNAMLQQYVPNYKINLVEPGNMESFEQFRTDLQEIFWYAKI